MAMKPTCFSAHRTNPGDERIAADVGVHDADLEK